MNLNRLTFSKMWSTFLTYFFKAVEISSRLQPLLQEMGRDFMLWSQMGEKQRMALLKKWDAPTLKTITEKIWEAHQLMSRGLIFLTKLRDDLRWVLHVTSPLPHSKSKTRPQVERLGDLMDATVTDVAEALEAYVGAKLYMDELASKLPIIDDADAQEAVSWVNSIESMAGDPVHLLKMVEGEEMAEVKALIKKVSS